MSYPGVDKNCSLGIATMVNLASPQQKWREHLEREKKNWKGYRNKESITFQWLSYDCLPFAELLSVKEKDIFFLLGSSVIVEHESSHFGLLIQFSWGFCLLFVYLFVTFQLFYLTYYLKTLLIKNQIFCFSSLFSSMSERNFPGYFVVQSLSHIWLCDPMDSSTPGPSAFHYLLEFGQIHVHWISDVF